MAAVVNHKKTRKPARAKLLCAVCQVAGPSDLITAYDGRRICQACFPEWATVCTGCANRARKLRSTSDRPLCRACEAPTKVPAAATAPTTKSCRQCGAEPHPTPQPDGTHLCVSCYNESVKAKSRAARASSQAPPASRSTATAPTTGSSSSTKQPSASSAPPSAAKRRASSAKPAQVRVTAPHEAPATSAAPIVKPKCVTCAKTARGTPFPDGYFYCTPCTPPLCVQCHAPGHPTPQPDGTHLCKDCHKAAARARKEAKQAKQQPSAAPEVSKSASAPASALKKPAATKKSEATVSKTPRGGKGSIEQAVAASGANVDVEMVALIVAAVQAARQRKA